MTRYSKGERTERELIDMLHSASYSVMRAAGSGVSSLSPDVIAVKDGSGYAFECKAWESTSLTIEPDRFEALKEWERNTHMKTFVAWRMNGKPWLLIKPDEMSMAEKNYTITRKNALKIGRYISELL